MNYARLRAQRKRAVLGDRTQSDLTKPVLFWLEIWFGSDNPFHLWFPVRYRENVTDTPKCTHEKGTKTVLKHAYFSSVRSASVRSIVTNPFLTEWTPAGFATHLVLFRLS